MKLDACDFKRGHIKPGEEVARRLKSCFDWSRDIQIAGRVWGIAANTNTKLLLTDHGADWRRAFYKYLK